MINLRLFVFIVLTLMRLNAQITFTEVMYDVDGPDYNDEFIEIYNLSEIDSVDLTGWYLSDSTNFDGLVSAGEGMKISPNNYAVILDGSYFENSTIYDDVIPDSSLIIKIDGGAFSYNGLTNTEPKTLMLFDADSQLVDAYRYTTDNEPSFSDEKIILNTNNQLSNWGNSLVKGGTPGFRNSIAPFDLDIGFTMDALSFHPSFLIQTLQPVTINCTITNTGTQDFEGLVTINIFIDQNDDSLIDSQDEIILQEEFGIHIMSVETEVVQTEWAPRRAGKFQLIALIESEKDQNKLNNMIQKEIIIVESRETVRINEIKFLTDEKEPEWIELINTGDEPVSMQGWGIADLKDTCYIDTALIIQPGAFKIIASDTGMADKYNIQNSIICTLKKLPSFNNSSETIYLLNPAGGWVEQVPYTIDWLEGEEWRNPSLERISYNLDSRLARNWGPCTEASGATPGKQNSLFAPVSHKNLKMKIDPNPFSPDDDGFEDRTIISIASPAYAARMRLDIYDILGRKIRTIKDNSFTGSNIDVVWNGCDDKGRKVKIGIYIIFLQILDDRNGILKELKESVVVAGKL
jgi:hypothetical protein